MTLFLPQGFSKKSKNTITNNFSPNTMNEGVANKLLLILFLKYFYGKMNKKYRFWVICKKGQLCIDVHIPSRGRLVRRELARSYKEAAAFFAPKLEAPTAFQCESWLLFEHHKEMLPPDCGIRRFADIPQGQGGNA